MFAQSESRYAADGFSLSEVTESIHASYTVACASEKIHCHWSERKALYDA